MFSWFSRRPLYGAIDTEATILELKKRLDVIEKKLGIEPPNPWFKIQNGVIIDPEGKPFYEQGVNLVGTTVCGPEANLVLQLDRIKATGCRLIRTLHISGTDGRPPSEYQPTLEEWRWGFTYYDRLIRLCKERGMYVWINLHHRQRLTEQEAKDLGVHATAFGERSAGVWPGEIGELFFLFPTVEEFVTKYCVELATRYKDEPTVAFITLANEKFGTRCRGYSPLLQRGMANPTQYHGAWFAKFNQFQAMLGIPDKDIHNTHIEQASSWNGCMVYKRMYDRLRAAGVKCPIFTSNIHGNCPMSALVECSIGDGIDCHYYPSSNIAYPDPFLPNPIRTMKTIANALRLEAYPLTLTEYAGVSETTNSVYSKGKLTSWLKSFDSVAQAGYDVSTVYAAWISWIGRFTDLNHPDSLYDMMEDPKAVSAYQIARAVQPMRVYETHQLSVRDVFGAWVKEVNPKNNRIEWHDTTIPVPGVQDWAQLGNLQNRLPELFWYPKKEIAV